MIEEKFKSFLVSLSWEEAKEFWRFIRSKKFNELIERKIQRKI